MHWFSWLVSGFNMTINVEEALESFDSERWRDVVQFAWTLAGALLLAGCASSTQKPEKDFAKALERGAYDNVSEMVSGYCNTVWDKGLRIQRTRIEARREIRQSSKGHGGPKPPEAPIPGLDAKTAEGKGPLLRIWCQGEQVPDVIWEDMVRDWRA
jgi:hypothetical protein